MMFDLGRPRRVAALAIFAVTLVVAALVAAGGEGPSSAKAAPGACVKHTKRVVTHPKRHGKRTRVVHLKHFWTCDEAPASSAPPTTTPAPSDTAPTAAPATPIPAPILAPLEGDVPPPRPPQPEPEPNALGVTAEDKGGLRYTLSRQTVKAGRLVVQLSNAGEDPHTMEMQRIGPDKEPEGPILTELATEPGEQPAPTATVEVQPGTYRMWCTIGHHAEHGMRAEFTVE